MTDELLSALKNIARMAGAILIGFVLLNANYLWQQAVFTIHHAIPGHNQVVVPGEIPADHIRIASLDIDAPLVYPVETNEAEFQKYLAEGVTHYPNTALPGQLGNAYYFGHSSDFPNKPGHYKTVFALLPRIKKGDEIMISDHDGRVFKYKVVQTMIVKPEETDVLDQQGNTQKLLTIQTSYPVGTALSRFVARAQIEP